ncbi:NTP-binding helicase protein [Rhizobium phage RHph_X2_28B]|uniref:NTP-binding helicase protein n=1 Tax=Rhizobium phage RHph_X2_28B TaxID=2836086 RepID=UPI0023291F6F|nr:NTP-binding helicase protein [Rhizobium phage RHph_X2_28B]QWY83514.1 NTP-binding helicase protein [Rhizobium phage RHph_X2_28B]QWY83750.1 NTP-binding helicase protein [Rhizobium phage RHph_X3_15]
MTEDTTVFNPQLVLISGESATGKSASLRNIRNQEKWMHLNPEAGKRLPFKNKFDSYTITDPYQVYEGLDAMRDTPDKWDGAIVDTITFLMDMYETKYVIGSSNTMQGWSNYQQYFKTLLQDKIASLGKPVIITAHVKDELDEAKMEMKTSVPIKGALKNNGVEAYFSTVVAAKKVSLKKLEGFKSDLLHITDEDEELGYKHVFQTRLTKETTGERIRSPMGLFTKAQTYMDNDAQLLLDHLKDFYA